MSDEASQIRILVADDHPIVREGVAALVGGQSDMRVVGEASNGREAIATFTGRPSASYRRIGRSAGSTRRPLSLRARHARHCQGILRGSCRAARGQPERRRAIILRCI